MSGETGENRPPHRKISEEEIKKISKTTKDTLRRLHDSRIKSYDERIGKQPSERELAEEAMRINISMTKLPEGEEADKQKKWARDYLKKLQQNPAGRTLFDQVSKKLIAEQKEKQNSD